MREWPIFSIGIVAAALCCILTPIVLALLGVAGLRAIACDLFLPLLASGAVLAMLVLGLRALTRRRRGASDGSQKNA